MNWYSNLEWQGDTPFWVVNICVEIISLQTPIFLTISVMREVVGSIK